MGEFDLSRWRRFCGWLALLIHRLANRIDRNAVYGLDCGEFQLMPIHVDELNGVWVTQDELAYQALILFGYPYPEGQDVDWSLEPPYGMSDDDKVTMRHEALEVARETIRQHVTLEERL